MPQLFPKVSIKDHAIPNLFALQLVFQKHLPIHPVPQRDPRTRGLLFEIKNGDLSVIPPHLAELSTVINPYLTTAGQYILAVNKTPPSESQDFAMRPHLDKRWTNGQFINQHPEWTQVMFIQFDAQGIGGELLVFHPAQQTLAAALPTQQVRPMLKELAPVLIKPEAGRVCRFSGLCPHAVLGYQIPVSGLWRMSIVLAKF